MNQSYYTFIALLVVIDPIGTAALFVAMTRDATSAERRQMAIRGTVIATILLLGFALGGEFLFRSLDITLSAFRVAGGILLFLLATDMVFARHSGLRATADEEVEAAHRKDISVFPLAIPLLAGPGALSSVVLLMDKAGAAPTAQLGVIAVLLLVMLITLAVLLGAARIIGLLGVTGTNVVSRALGIILAALAAQFFIRGIQESLFSGGPVS